MTIGTFVDELKTAEMEELVVHARQRLEFGRTFRNEKRENAWRQAERQYEGRHWTGATPNDPTADLVVVNVSFSTVNTLVPYVTGSDPRFLVEPYSADATIRGARAQAAWLNRFWRTPDSGSRPAVRAAAMDHLVYGDGWGKVTWRIQPNDAGQDIAEIYVDRVDPWNVWVDPMADDFGNARWVCERIWTTLPELEADGTFKNLKDLEGSTPALEDAEGDRDRVLRATEADHKDAQWVELYEYWDLVERRMVVFARGGRYPLKVVEDVTCPLVSLGNHWLPRQPYHMGDLEQIWSLQQELNKTRSQMMTHRRRNIPKWMARADALEDTAEEAIMSEQVGAVIKIKGDRPLDDVIQPVAMATLGADSYNVSDLTMRDVYEITGVTEYLRGATPAIRRTATEAAIIEGASNVKSAHKLSKIEDFVRDLGRLVLLIAADVFPQTEYEEMQLFLTGRDAEALNKVELGERLGSLMDRGADPELLRMEAEGASLNRNTLLSLGPETFTGVYQVEVVANSTELRNPIFKEQKYREMAAQLTQAAPLLTQMGVPLNLRKIYELWFEAAGIQDIDAMFEPQQGPGIPMQAPQAPMQRGGGLGSLLQTAPNLESVQPPLDLLTAENTGAMPPE